MHIPTPKALLALTGLLAFSTANPLTSSSSSLQSLDSRACGAGCNNAYPLTRKLGEVCGCGEPYVKGDRTCSCNLRAIVSAIHRLPQSSIALVLPRKKQSAEYHFDLESIFQFPYLDLSRSGKENTDSADTSHSQLVCNPDTLTWTMSQDCGAENSSCYNLEDGDPNGYRICD